MGILFAIQECNASPIGGTDIFIYFSAIGFIHIFPFDITENMPEPRITVTEGEGTIKHIEIKFQPWY